MIVLSGSNFEEGRCISETKQFGTWFYTTKQTIEECAHYCATIKKATGCQYLPSRKDKTNCQAFTYPIHEIEDKGGDHFCLIFEKTNNEAKEKAKHGRLTKL